jgi:hypothetical protein
MLNKVLFLNKKIATIFDKDQPEIEYDLLPLNIPNILRTKNKRTSLNNSTQSNIEYNYVTNSHLIFKRVFNSNKKRESEDGKKFFFKLLKK